MATSQCKTSGPLADTCDEIQLNSTVLAGLKFHFCDPSAETPTRFGDVSLSRLLHPSGGRPRREVVTDLNDWSDALVAFVDRGREATDILFPNQVHSESDLYKITCDVSVREFWGWFLDVARVTADEIRKVAVDISETPRQTRIDYDKLATRLDVCWGITQEIFWVFLAQDPVLSEIPPPRFRKTTAPVRVDDQTLKNMELKSFLHGSS